MNESGSTSARDAILARIRSAVGDAPDVGSSPRDYRTSGDASRDERLDLFIERLEDYQVITHRCAPSDLSATVASLLRHRGASRVVVAHDLDRAWTEGADIEWSFDGDGTRLDHRELDQVDAVLTGCAVAIAETGTIVLDGGVGQGRRAITLVPDVHLCIVYADQVIETVPEGVDRLADAVRSGRPLTMISGPSATSDIELSRVEGVHGPRTLEVVLVEG